MTALHATPLRMEPRGPHRFALVPDHAASRAYATQLEARERAEAARANRTIIRRALDILAPAIIARLERRA